MLVEKNTNVARFYKHWAQNNFQSEKQGKPIGEEVDYIEIRSPKDKLNVFKRLATAQDKSNYPAAWELYQRGPEQAAEGTPLCKWSVMTETTISMLNSHDIHTIETLASLSDAGLHQIGQGALQLQQGAKLFLEEALTKAAGTSAENVALRVQVDELRQENEALRVEKQQLEARLAVPEDTKIASLEAENAELEARMAKQREKIKKQTKKIDTLKLKNAA